MPVVSLVTAEELERLRAWAEARIAVTEQPPWQRFQYMKLRDALDGIFAVWDATALQATRQPPDRHLRLVDAAYVRQDSVRSS